MLLPYDRTAAVRYAHRWAYGRNPRFYDYEALGGDCTNFASQCLYAGSGIMDLTPVYGWYYLTPNDKAPAWTGVPYFYNFMVHRTSSPGPVGRSVPPEDLLPGDFVQLSFGAGLFSHTPIVVEVGCPGDLSTILVAAHSDDADWRSLTSYPYTDIRFLHIQGIRPISSRTGSPSNPV